MALTAKPVSGWSSVRVSQSAASWPCSWLRASSSGGVSPPSVIDITTEVSEMPSPMQWWSAR